MFKARVVLFTSCGGVGTKLWKVIAAGGGATLFAYALKRGWVGMRKD